MNLKSKNKPDSYTIADWTIGKKGILLLTINHNTGVVQEKCDLCTF